MDWQPRPAGAPERDGDTFYEKGSVKAAEANFGRKVEALFCAPYLAHATLEPMNCMAQVLDGKVKLCVPTQVPDMAVAIAARVAGLPVENVHSITTVLGGGFGRRLGVDFVGQAVCVTMECGGRTVQLNWSREEYLTHDFYRPMHVAVLRAAVGPAGKLPACASDPQAMPYRRAGGTGRCVH